MRKTRAVMLSAAISSGLLVLAACSKSEPETPPIDNIETPALETAPAMNQPEPMPTETAPPPVNTADALPPPAPVEPDQQMLDDAAAVGMTARADRSQPGEEAPVQNAQ